MHSEFRVQENKCSYKIKKKMALFFPTCGHSARKAREAAFTQKEAADHYIKSLVLQIRKRDGCGF